MKLISPERAQGQPRPQPTGSVGYVFGVLEAAAVPGTVLVPLLVDLGMSAAAVRTMLHRMVASGNMVSDRIGRLAVYRLAGGYADRFREFRQGGGPPDWDGRFQLVLYTIPEARRQHRDELRETAFKAGFGATRPGVLIGFRDPHSWCRAWLGIEDFSVELGELVCSLPTARRLAERAWGLTAVQPQLTSFLTDLSEIEGRLRRDEYGERDAFGLQARLWERWVAILIGLPHLPPALAPDPWPVPALAAAMEALSSQLQPRAVAYARSVVERVEGSDLLELLPDARYRP